MGKEQARRWVSLLVVVLLAGCSTTPSSTVSPPAPKNSYKTSAQEQVYYVRSGDTLSAIGRRFGVTSLQIQYRNGIADPHRLKVGARLIIPAQNQQVPSAYANKARFIWPLKRLDVSSEFGSRNGRHKGIDLRAPKGTAIRAAADGVVHFVGRQNGYGKVIILKHAGNIQTFYAHNHKNLVNTGQQVRQGEKIATVGRTGNATGYHVHFEYIQGRQPLNPRHHLSN